MDIDLPEVVAEVEAAFARYEQALVANDVAALDAMFHDDARTIRYGGAGNLYGYQEIEGFPPAGPRLGFFHDDPPRIRYGGTENLYGYQEIEAFRAARSPIGLARTLSKTVIT